VSASQHLAGSNQQYDGDPRLLRRLGQIRRIARALWNQSLRVRGRGARRIRSFEARRREIEAGVVIAKEQFGETARRYAAVVLEALAVTAVYGEGMARAGGS
jgi:hypothetical protein